ncbi:MAG: long-chain fatty acid--CoA ligase [Elusimicrobia bacterium]|nr:long-chain fatty acid--CoA ligase [Elusimicrobiota bacterium]
MPTIETVDRNLKLKIQNSKLAGSGRLYMTLNQMLDQTVRQHGSKLGYIYRGQKISFAEMSQKADALAAALGQLGIRPGDRFALCVRNSIEFVTTWFACARLGAIAVHINFMTSQDEMAYILKDSGAKGVLIQKEFGGKIRPAAATAGAGFLVSIDEQPKNSGEYLFSDLENRGRGQHYDRFEAQKNTTAAILYTSGTTGKPKGAMLSHLNLASNVQDAVFHLGFVPQKEVMLCILPMFHIFALTAIILASVYLAVPIVIVESVTPPQHWLKLIAKWKVTVFPAIPPIYHALANKAKGIKGLVLKYLFFRTVKKGISGAAPLPAEVLERFEKKFGVPIYEGYGLTETSPVISANAVVKRKPGTVGIVIPNVKVKIVNDQEEELPTGEEGEIVVKGPNVMQGYFNLPQESKECFTQDGFFKTGDIGRFDAEGFLTICDRKKDMIIIKGLKVFPAQIEQIILNHPGVAEAAVVGIPVEGGDEIIKAFVTAKEGSVLNKTELQEMLQAKLPPYKRPREIEVREALPKNALQKILKRVLRREAQEKMKNQRAEI